MIQASDGGRVYVGKSALEIKLRETPIASAYGNDGPTPTPVVVLSTERMVCEVPSEQPAASTSRAEPFAPVIDEQVARTALLTKSTIVGLCLTAFAFGIITTVTFDHQRLRALERQVQAQAEALAAAAKPAPAEPAAAAVPAPRAAPAELAAAAEPVVEQLPAASAAPAASSEPPATDKAAEASAPVAPKATGPRLTAARTPRPPAPRAAVRRRSTPPAESAASEEPAAATWVDPFAE